MWQPWSRFLEFLGRIRLPFAFILRNRPSIGDPAALDAEGGAGWKDHLRPEALFRIWGPLDGSPWEPYHAVPIFAALDRVRRNRLGPTAARVVEAEGALGDDGASGGSGGGFVLPAHARPGAPAPAWAISGTMIVLELPDRASVEAAAWLIGAAGVQPVCTFDNWPHPNGVLPTDRVLAELLRWATTVAGARGRITGDAPPLWICDSTRLGTRTGRPGEYDNRYYLDDSILPSPALLRAHGVHRVVHLGWSRWDGGQVDVDAQPVPLADLVEWFTDMLTGGIEVMHAPITDPALALHAFRSEATARPFRGRGYRRSAAGGFGTELPEPSSSGSSG